MASPHSPKPLPCWPHHFCTFPTEPAQLSSVTDNVGSTGHISYIFSLLKFHPSWSSVHPHYPTSPDAAYRLPPSGLCTQPPTLRLCPDTGHSLKAYTRTPVLIGLPLPGFFSLVGDRRGDKRREVEHGGGELEAITISG